jgi:hypothetical protein
MSCWETFNEILPSAKFQVAFWAHLIIYPPSGRFYKDSICLEPVTMLLIFFSGTIWIGRQSNYRDLFDFLNLI